MSADTPVTAPPSLTRALQLAAAGVAAVTFALSFYGLNDYAQQSMALPSWLSWLVPIGLDGLQLVAIVATFMLRAVRLRVRVYAWAVFGVAAGLSMAGNHQHAVTRHLDAGGVIGFTVAPVVLALSAHLVVVTWRNLEQPTVAVTPPVTVAPPVTSELPPPPADSPVTDEEEMRLCREAAALRASRTPWSEIARRQGVSESTVRRRVKRAGDTPTALAVA